MSDNEQVKFKELHVTDGILLNKAKLIILEPASLDAGFDICRIKGLLGEI